MMDHIVLNVEDMERIMAFYIDIMELQPERLEAYRRGAVPFPSVRLNADTVIDLFPKRLWGGCSGRNGCDHLNHFCIALKKEAWEGLIERLHAAKIAVEEGPVLRWGARGSGTSIYFRDPEGNRVEARYYEIAGERETCLLGS